MQPILIFLLEDNPVNLAIYTAMLKSLGAEVDSAENMTEARVKLTSGRKHALLIMDIQLPDGEGTTLAQEYVAMGGRAPLLFLSAPENAVLSDITIHQASGFLPKPFNLRQLQEAIDELL